MVTSGLDAEQVLDPHTQIAFPESVVSLFRGDLGQPYGGFSAGAAEEGAERRAAVDGAAGRGAAADRPGTGARRAPSQDRGESHRRGVRSYLMYPKVFLDYMQARQNYGQVTVLPTPMFFYGLEPATKSASTSSAARR
jgi:pyruvate carboxylase